MEAVERFLADTGASVCLAGTEYMQAMGVSRKDLTRCDMSVRGAGGKSIPVLGAMIVHLSQPGAFTKQIMYVCDGVASPILSLEACEDLGLVGDRFPGGPSSVSASNSHTQVKESGCKCGCPVREVAPDVPVKIPYEPILSNLSKLEQWIRDEYAASAFNVCECQPLPAMHGPPLKIFMNPEAKPKASHSPIPIPVHWQKEVLQGLERMLSWK